MNLVLATSEAVSISITIAALSNTCLLSVKSFFSSIAFYHLEYPLDQLVSFSLFIWNTFLLPVPQHATLLSGLNTVIILCQFAGLYLRLLASFSCITVWCKMYWAAFEIADAGHGSTAQDATEFSWSQPAGWWWSTAAPQAGSWVERRHAVHCSGSVPVSFAEGEDDKSHICVCRFKGSSVFL